MVPCDGHGDRGPLARGRLPSRREPVPVTAVPGSLRAAASTWKPAHLSHGARARANTPASSSWSAPRRRNESPLQQPTTTPCVSPVTLLVCAATWLLSGDPRPKSPVLGRDAVSLIHALPSPSRSDRRAAGARSSSAAAPRSSSWAGCGSQCSARPARSSAGPGLQVPPTRASAGSFAPPAGWSGVDTSRPHGGGGGACPGVMRRRQRGSRVGGGPGVAGPRTGGDGRRGLRARQNPGGTAPAAPPASRRAARAYVSVDGRGRVSSSMPIASARAGRLSRPAGKPACAAPSCSRRRPGQRQRGGGVGIAGDHLAQAKVASVAGW
jgi:hypothetical protein